MKTDYWIKAYIDHLSIVGNFSEHSVRAYLTDLNHFNGFVKQNNIEHIDRKKIRSYIALLSDTYDPSSIARKMAAIRSFFKFCFHQKWIKENPMISLSSPKQAKKLPLLLTPKQVQMLIDSPKTDTYLGLRDRAILELFYSSALRVSELTTLNKKNIHFDSLFITVKGKGKKERSIPITSNCAHWLKLYLTNKERFIKTNTHKAEQDKEAVFLNKWGTRITPRSVDRLFAFYVKETRLPKTITPHDMRHSIATHLLENGMNIYTIQKILGHRNINTTTIYAKASVAKTLETYDNCFPKDLNQDEHKNKNT